MGKYHFIAIGGIGMSGLAKYLLEEGHTVSGSDIEDSKYISALRDLGAKVSIGHNADNVPSEAIIVVSSAIRENNPELVRARELGLKIYHRSDLLAEISESAKSASKCFIGFSGTHGKTTTSGLASYLLDKSGYNPSFVVGGIIPDISVNAQYKDGKYFVAELDESDGTITKYNSDILVINNLEEDHLDYYKNGMSDLINTFNIAVSKSKKIIINADNNGVKNLNGNFITFGLGNADFSAKNINYTNNGLSFDMYKNNEFLITIKSQLNGVHNVYNTLSVATALYIAGVDLKSVKDYFETFSGMSRRFQKICEFNGIEVYDDYAHHPTEIKATLDAVSKKYADKNIIAVFQPHRYTRLKGLWNEFKNAFSDANEVIVTDIYSASEDPIEGITAEKFASELDGASYLSGNMEEVANKLYPTLTDGDVVIALGAGTITALGNFIKKQGETNLASRVQK
ncbi:MAG: UDP-N-acetylmuramate--L-alanine ligase [bacterium]|nr:UDP-N-acetylmuramate--L-alanine ligase [bacterium]